MSTGLTKAEKIDHSIDRPLANAVAISREAGGLDFTSYGEVLEFAKIMALSQQAVPPHCRNQPGVCLGLTIQAIEWRMSPYAVANKSYVVNDRIAYESQLIHAVVEQRAPITARLRHRYIGEGDQRQCVVWATAKGEDEPLEYTSPPIKHLIPKRNEKGQLKGSPLWETKPDLQLFYNASRDWARMYFPDVIMGVYSMDELDESIIDAKPIAPVKDLDQLAEQLERSNAEKDSEALQAAIELEQRKAEEQAEGSHGPGTHATEEAGPEGEDDESAAAEEALVRAQKMLANAKDASEVRDWYEAFIEGADVQFSGEQLRRARSWRTEAIEKFRDGLKGETQGTLID